MPFLTDILNALKSFVVLAKEPDHALQARSRD
jgi:hypothetical protein